MADKKLSAEKSERLKKELGRKIKECRGDESLRGLARAVGIPPSNMKYIEDGINAPSPEVYRKIIEALKPTPSDRKKMDFLFMELRNMPPPDVSDIIIKNRELVDTLRLLEKRELTDEQREELNSLLLSFFDKV